MGSFSEVALSFSFAEETPGEVLAAFSRLATSEPSATAPSLPEPTVEPWEWFAPDWRDAGYEEGEGDPFESEPWRHDWAPWVSTAMGVRTTPHGLLAWSRFGGWNLDCRFSWKAGPESVELALSWLAPYVSAKYASGPILVGYVHYEYDAKPHLFWVDDGRWLREDLNPRP